MAVRTLSLIVLLLAGLPATAQAPDIQNQVEKTLTLARLQGVWIPHLLLTKEGAEPYPLSGRAMQLERGRFVRIEGKRVVSTGTFKVEDGFLRLTATERTPWNLEAPPKKQARFAFKVEGDLLTLSFTAKGAGKAGDLTPGKGRTVVVYKRQAAK